MIRTLFIIAGAALVLSIVTLAGGLALGGHDLQKNGWSWTFNESKDSFRLQRTTEATRNLGPEITRTETWTGGATLANDSMLDIEYIEGPANTVEITGPRALVESVRFENGKFTSDSIDDTVTISWNNRQLVGVNDRDRLKIVVTAPSVSRFDISGSGDLTIRGYDQPSLSVGINGSGDVTASGRTENLVLKINGSGDAELGDLATTNATVMSEGSGEAEIAATGDARITLNGSGDVVLASRPTNLISNTRGSGEVRQN